MASDRATLTIYVTEQCPGCERARRTARAVRERVPDARVELVDLSDGSAPPSSVFGVPAYILNGQLVSHGNPRIETLINMIETQTGGRGGDDSSSLSGQ